MGEEKEAKFNKQDIKMNDHINIVEVIIQKEIGEKPLKVERMVIGIMNEVYLVTLASQKLIIRMNTKGSQLQGSEKHIDLFSSIGIKVPKILASDYTKKDFSYSYQILSYIEGKDLGQVIESLTEQELKTIAKEVVNILRKLSTIPTNGKFGWVGADESRLVDSWATIMKADKIKKRNEQTGVVGDELMRKEEEIYNKYLPYFNSVKSTLYFDDISSKNILIKEGKFMGLVDLDDISYGDPLEAVGSIKASWYGTTHGEIYTKAVETELGINQEQKEMVTVYALLNRILWLSERGIKFNENTSEKIDEGLVAYDKKIIEGLLRELDQFAH